ncbi:hypothetical protein [Symmachiella dynata]|uniref:hypothetical protein n=1 Tax=Symmachiella dynata TaxID=2527995 RepID=UPI0030EBF6B3
MNIGWHGVRFGLTLNRISSQAIAIVFLLHSAISLALAPWVVGHEVNGLVGFGLGILIAAIYLGIVRFAFITDADEKMQLIVFVILSIVVCQLVYAHPATLERILTALGRITPPVLLACCGLFFVGSIFSITPVGNILRWLFSAAALVALFGAIVLTLEITKIGGEIPVPAMLRDSPLYKFPQMFAVGLGCLGILFQALSLQQIARRFHDTATGKYTLRFMVYHLFASAVVLGIDYLLRDHTTQPVITVGAHIFDSVTILASAAIGLAVVIDGMWLSRAIGGAHDLINRQRG